ncbi:MAG: hypothetical protein ABI760_24670 [Ferruginibacter sp.]
MAFQRSIFKLSGKPGDKVFMIQDAFNVPPRARVVVLEFMCCVFDFPGKWGEKYG